MERFDFAVIGAGIAGASAAYELAAHGRVAVLEQERAAGHHTTGRSAALFTVAYERDVVQVLAGASRSFLQDPPSGFTDTPLLSPCPLLIIGTAAQRSLVVEAVELARPAVPDVELLDGLAAERLCPILRPGYVAAAASESGSYSIDVHALHQGFLSAARRRGAVVKLRARVDRLQRAGSAWLVAGEGVALEAGVVVNAAGAWADRVAALAGAAPVGLQPYRRTAFTFATPDGVDASALPMVIDVEERFYFKPEGGTFLGSLAEETPMEPHDVRPEEADVALAIERIEAATTLRIRHVKTAWAGLRTFAPDRHPVNGMDPSVDGFYWLAGQGGTGIMTSPAAARVAAGLIVEGAVPDDVAGRGVTAEALGPARLR